MIETNLTAFQRKCLDKVKEYLIKSKFLNPSEFREVAGENETYLVSKLFLQDSKKCIDIYIYRSEAGFMINDREWHICEKQDYDSDDDLICDFLDKLRQKVEA